MINAQTCIHCVSLSLLTWVLTLSCHGKINFRYSVVTISMHPAFQKKKKIKSKFWLCYFHISGAAQSTPIWTIVAPSLLNAVPSFRVLYFAVSRDVLQQAGNCHRRTETSHFVFPCQAVFMTSQGHKVRPPTSQCYRTVIGTSMNVLTIMHTTLGSQRFRSDSAMNSGFRGLTRSKISCATSTKSQQGKCTSTMRRLSS